MPKNKESIKIGLLSPFLPKKDGIAIYSNNLISNMDLKDIKIIKIGDFESEADYKINFKSFRLRNQLKKIIKKEKLDLLHIQYVPTLFGKYNLNLNLIRALKLRTPIIITLHEVHYSNKSLRDFILSWIEKQLIKSSKKIIVHTPQQKEFVENKYRRKNVGCIYHGLNFYRKNKRKNKNILFFGYITPLKGLEYLIKAMKYLPDCNLKIAGHIPKDTDQCYKNKIIRIKNSKLEGKIKLDIRWIPEKEKEKYFRWADIVILPYLWAPYQSGILHNAMSYGIPIVVTKVGCLHEIVELFKIGKIVPPKNPELLANGIKDVFREYDKFRKNIEEYRMMANWGNIAEEHKELYRSILT